MTLPCAGSPVHQSVNVEVIRPTPKFIRSDRSHRWRYGAHERHRVSASRIRYARARRLPDRTPMITKVETDLHAELEIIDSDKRIDILIRHLAVARLARNFEQFHRTLYGSQIRALRALSDAEGGRTSRAESEAYFDQVKAKYADFYEKNTFDEWIRYPVSAGLIEAKNEQVIITELGRDFLGYTDAFNLSDSARPW